MTEAHRSTSPNKPSTVDRQIWRQFALRIVTDAGINGTINGLIHDAEWVARYIESGADGMPEIFPVNINKRA